MFVFDNKIDLEKSQVLYTADFESKDWEKDWEISGGEWSVDHGILTGIFRGNGGGLIYSKQNFPGDIMLDFYGTMIPPCSNDLNFTFRARGWDYEKNDADIGYIAGLNGWWTDRTGIEKYPECDVQALTSFFKAEAGKEYHIQTGIIKDRCFLAVDGCVIVEMRDPEPINAPDCQRVGLGTYASQIQFRDFKVIRPYYEHTPMSYAPVF